ncbi:MAG: YhcH/YjgK/YiaL family protein [Candidatus Latescibacterota bacterium]
MILDIRKNAHCYLPLSKGFEKAFEFLMRPDLEELEPGRYEIDGTRVYALVMIQNGRRREDALLETHDRYLDIQLILAGTDEMGWKPKSSCKNPTAAYDPDGDAQLFADQPDAWVATGPEAFAIFFPQDAHMPMISSGELHKVVIKVAMDQS